jgi:hypothetical protein
MAIDKKEEKVRFLNITSFTAASLVVSVVVLLLLALFFGMLLYKFLSPPPTSYTGPLKNTNNYLNVNGTTLDTVEIATNPTPTEWTFSNGTISSTGTYLTVKDGSLTLDNAPTDGSVWSFDGLKFTNVASSLVLVGTTVSAASLDPITIETGSYTAQYTTWWSLVALSLGIATAVIGLVTLIILIAKAHIKATYWKEKYAAPADDSKRVKSAKGEDVAPRRLF